MDSLPPTGQPPTSKMPTHLALNVFPSAHTLTLRGVRAWMGSSDGLIEVLFNNRHFAQLVYSLLVQHYASEAERDAPGGAHPRDGAE